MPEALHNYKKTQTYVVRPHPGSHLMMISRCYKYLNPLDSMPDCYINPIVIKAKPLFTTYYLESQ